jgi:hypothetical protein
VTVEQVWGRAAVAELRDRLATAALRSVIQRPRVTNLGPDLHGHE